MVPSVQGSGGICTTSGGRAAAEGSSSSGAAGGAAASEGSAAELTLSEHQSQSRANGAADRGPSPWHASSTVARAAKRHQDKAAKHAAKAAGSLRYKYGKEASLAGKTKDHKGRHYSKAAKRAAKAGTRTRQYLGRAAKKAAAAASRQLKRSLRRKRRTSK